MIASHRGIYRYFAKRSPPLRPLLAALFAARAAAKLAAAAVGAGRYARSHPGGSS